jgi:hypothetical protein
MGSLKSKPTDPIRKELVNKTFWSKRFDKRRPGRKYAITKISGKSLGRPCAMGSRTMTVMYRDASGFHKTKFFLGEIAFQTEDGEEYVTVDKLLSLVPRAIL